MVEKDYVGLNIIKSRVFISCGQKDEEEKKIATEIETRLSELGYEPYVAIHKQSTGSLISNILLILKVCEYYLFVDFRREMLIIDSRIDPISYDEDKLQQVEHRGSLFSNQELAISTYLEKPLIAFQEKGVKKRDGLLSAIQANVIMFEDRRNLVDEIIRKVKVDWRSNWRNQIIFKDIEGKSVFPEYIDEYGPSKWPARFFHINVENLHKDTSAYNCVAYLESYKVISKTVTERNAIEIIWEPIELKWKGMKTQSVLIPPKTDRKFDAVYIYENIPQTAYVGINPFLVDLSSYLETLEGVEIFELNYVVYSDNFQPIRSTYILELKEDLNETRFYRKQKSNNNH